MKHTSKQHKNSKHDHAAAGAAAFSSGGQQQRRAHLNGRQRHLTTNPSISQGRHTTNNVHAAQHAQHKTAGTSSGVMTGSSAVPPSFGASSITTGAGASVAVVVVSTGASTGAVVAGSAGGAGGASSDMIGFVK
ncbi:hypothetical protein DCAR_0104182 [Daucus carota subsp. sativus]|uniref:Uncharacterized protein n=1 Tax=Daucus carota subsp. sativus TaxID=79200 RepID=A0A166IM36_DAUCS|nr:hypothetical protein DCAR_0104182 [Daucus carota subsp. sativus]